MKKNSLPPLAVLNWRWVEEGDGYVGRLQPPGQPLGVGLPSGLQCLVRPYPYHDMKCVLRKHRSTVSRYVRIIGDPEHFPNQLQEYLLGPVTAAQKVLLLCRADMLPTAQRMHRQKKADSPRHAPMLPHHWRSRDTGACRAFVPST
jgi:hypothetical protein